MPQPVCPVEKAADVQAMTQWEHSSCAVVYTRTQRERQYVLVVERHGHCGLPKGHIESGETVRQVALREILEETGIRAALREDFVRVVTCSMPNGHLKRVTYYLASFSDQNVQPGEGEVQSAMLLPYEQAMKALTYENNRCVLREAHAFLNQEESA